MTFTFQMMHGSMALIKNEVLDAKEELNKTTQGEI